MQNNEESILIVNKKNKRKKSNEKDKKIKNYSLISKYIFNPFCITIFIFVIILFIFLIINIKSFFSSNIINSSESESSNFINNQTLINELNNIINSFEKSSISNPQNIQEKIGSPTNIIISVIIPVLNNAEKIKLTIHSIQYQNMTDIEIIIIDDNSEDNTVKLIEEIQKEDPRIKLLKNQNNKGILYSRSIGVLNSKGKFIFPINSGDIFINDIFKTCYEQAEMNILDIIEFPFYNISKINSSISQLYFTNFSYLESHEAIIMQPELSNFIYKEKNESNQKYELIDELIWGKFIKNIIYKKTIEMLNLLIYSEKVMFFESQIIIFGLFKNANSFKFINIKGIVHIHNTKLINDKSQFYHDNIIYMISLFKNTQNKEDAKISIFELEKFFDFYPNDFINEHKKILFELFNEMNECKFIDEDKKKELIIKMKNILKNIILIYLKIKFFYKLCIK